MCLSQMLLHKPIYKCAVGHSAKLVVVIVALLVNILWIEYAFYIAEQIIGLMNAMTILQKTTK